MNLGFGLPALLGGLALVGVPILIHLLNRRRFVIVPFAAMRFLQDAFAQRRRRLRMESLLLLLLRCLIVVLAALAMALPFVPEDSPLAGLAGGRRELVAVVDRSASMGRLAAPGLTLDDRTLGTLRRRIGQLSDERGDAVTLIFLGGGPELPAPIGATPSMALATLEKQLPPPRGVADLVAAARLIKDRVRPQRPGRLDVLVFSDLQRLSWTDAGGAVGPLLASAFEQGGGSLRVIDAAAGLPEASNTGVLELASAQPLLPAKEPLAFTAVVRNWSDAARAGVECRFFLDDVQRAVQRVDLAPQGTATAELRLRIDTPGPHHLGVALERDELPFDDSRTLAFEVREHIAVLLVDGAPGGAEALSGATGYLALALDPEGQTRRFEPTVWDAGRLDEGSSQLGGFDAIVLANVGGLSAAAAAALAGAVQGGTPLLVFAGDLTEPAFYNERLPQLGLTLPAQIGAMSGDPSGHGGEDYVTLALPDATPGPLSLFSDPRLAVLLQVPVFAWRPLEPREGSRVLATFADAAGTTTPALVEGRVGRGRVLLVGTAADASWSLLPRNPALWVPMVHELLSSLLAADPAETNLPVGQSPALVVAGLPLSAQLTWPSKAVTTVERPDIQPAGAGRSRLELSGLPLEEAGAYLLEVNTAQGSQRIALAAVPDAREGDLRRIGENELAQALSGVEWQLGGEELDEEQAPQPGDGSLAQALLWALFAAAVLESALARWMGVRG